MTVLGLTAALFGVTATFVHAGEDIPLLGFIFGTASSGLLAGLVFMAAPGKRESRRLAALASFLLAAPILTVGVALAMNQVALGTAGSRVYPALVAAEGVYLRIVPEPSYYHEVHRVDHLFNVRLLRALESCDGHLATQMLDEAEERHRAAVGRDHLFVRVVVTRFVDEGPCAADLRQVVKDRVAPWLRWYRSSGGHRGTTLQCEGTHELG